MISPASGMLIIIRSATNYKKVFKGKVFSINFDES